MMAPIETARRAVEIARALGAEQSKAGVGRSTKVELQQRDGKLERCSEASTFSLSIRLMVDGRYSGHATSDLRPDALEAFLKRAIDGTRYLEPDPERAMLPREEMGSLDPDSLDVDDAEAFEALSAEGSRARIEALDAAVRARAPKDMVSSTAHLYEVRSEGWSVFSNGFEGRNSRTWFGWGAEMTVKEDSGKLPEAYNFVTATHFADVPDLDVIVADLLDRVALTRASGPGASGVSPMILDNRCAGRIIGTLLGPLSGGNLYERRSCFLDRLGDSIGSKAFSLWDDPTVPRGMGSRPFDGDGMKAERRPIFEEGALKTYFLDVYHARKLGMAPTTGGTSNIVMQPGMRSWQQIAADLPRAIRVTGFLGGNSNPASGDFSFGIRGQLLEHGEPVANLSEMNVSGNLTDLVSRFAEAADDPWTYSSYRLPSLLFEGVQFSGT